jgi:ribosomal protein L40E
MKARYTEQALAVMRAGDGRVCERCGPRHEQDAEFCSNCGAALLS